MSWQEYRFFDVSFDWSSKVTGKTVEPWHEAMNCTWHIINFLIANYFDKHSNCKTNLSQTKENFS